VLAVLQSAKDLPPWVRGIRGATQEEDAQGKDIIIATDVGEIGLQVKSGRTTAEKYYERGQFLIGLVIVRSRQTGKSILRRAVRELEEIRTAIQRGAAGWLVTP
jgi:hypothetical protein